MLPELRGGAMDLRQVEYVVAAVDTGTFTAAAAALSCEAPAGAWSVDPRSEYE